MLSDNSYSGYDFQRRINFSLFAQGGIVWRLEWSLMKQEDLGSIPDQTK